MEVCHNCKNKSAEYKCDICRRTYCQQCDLYIHSFSSKNYHSRTNLFSKSSPVQNFENSKNKYTTDKNGFYVYTGNSNLNYSFYKNKKNPLFEETKEEIDLQNKNNYKINKDNYEFDSDNKKSLSPEKLNYIKKTYNLDSDDENNNKIPLSVNPLSDMDTLNESSSNLKKNKSFNSCMAKNNLLQVDEKLRLIKKISQLNCELSNTRSDIDQKIDILHDHLHLFHEANKKEMNKLNYKNINEINMISSQKDTLLKHLRDVINDQNEVIEKLTAKKKKLQDSIDENKFLIEKYSTEKNNYLKEKENSEKIYKTKKEMLEERHEIEMQKIRKDYDTELDRLNEKYRNNKIEYLNEIKKGNEMIEDFKLQGQKQIEVLSKDINILQNQNDIKNKEVNDMITNNKTLKESLDNYNGRFDDANEKLRENQEQKEMMKKIYDETFNELMKRKKENEKLHGLMYGKFFDYKNLV
jgi:hypothetical protein